MRRSTEYELVNTDVGELDITKVDEVMKFVREVKPYAIPPANKTTAYSKPLQSSNKTPYMALPSGWAHIATVMIRIWKI